MTDTVLIWRGFVEQVWRGTPRSALDPRAHRGELLEVEGPVAAGMAYRDGRFWATPPRPSWEAIRAEADRRVGSVFPEALQEQLASVGGALAAGMHRYIVDCERRAQRFASMDSAPEDFRADEHWPAIPDLVGAPVAVPIEPTFAPRPVVIDGQAVTVRQPPQEVAVRVIIDRSGATDVAPVVTSHVTRQAENIAPDQGALSGVVTSKRPGVTPDDLAALKFQVVMGLAAVAEAHDFEVGQLAELAADATAATTREGVLGARDRAMQIMGAQ